MKETSSDKGFAVKPDRAKTGGTLTAGLTWNRQKWLKRSNFFPIPKVPKSQQCHMSSIVVLSLPDYQDQQWTEWEQVKSGRGVGKLLPDPLSLSIKVSKPFDHLTNSNDATRRSLFWRKSQVLFDCPSDWAMSSAAILSGPLLVKFQIKHWLVQNH